MDDYIQNITHIVRGADLLESTAPQIFIQNKLGLPRPLYMHVPIIIDEHGQKLSKQTFAKPVHNENPKHVIFTLLKLLQQSPPLELAENSLTDILNWGIAHWKPEALKQIEVIKSDY